MHFTKFLLTILTFSFAQAKFKICWNCNMCENSNNCSGTGGTGGKAPIVINIFPVPGYLPALPQTPSISTSPSPSSSPLPSTPPPPAPSTPSSTISSTQKPPNETPENSQTTEHPFEAVDFDSPSPEAPEAELGPASRPGNGGSSLPELPNAQTLLNPLTNLASGLLQGLGLG